MSDLNGRAASMAAHPAGKELFSTPRMRVRSGFFVRWDAIVTVIVAALIAFCLGMATQYAIDHAPAAPAQSAIPACPTEDSWGCRWDADVQGNGEGRSFVVDRYGVITYDDGEVFVPECTDDIADRGGICQGPLL